MDFQNNNAFFIGLADKSQGLLFEKLTGILYEHYLESGDCFCDAGCGHGLHTIAMARRVGERGRGLAIDANPGEITKLSAKLAKHKIFWVETIACGLHQNSGEMPFYISDATPGWSSLYASHSNLKGAVRTSLVQLRTLDDIFDEYGVTQCRFIKLDIENAEIMALQGANRILTYHRPMLVFENSPRSAARLNGYDSLAFFQLFERHGYQVFDILGNAFTPEHWQQNPLLPYYMAAHKEARLPDLLMKWSYREKIAAAVRQIETGEVLPKPESRRPLDKLLRKGQGLLGNLIRSRSSTG